MQVTQQGRYHSRCLTLVCSCQPSLLPQACPCQRGFLSNLMCPGDSDYRHILDLKEEGGSREGRCLRMAWTKKRRGRTSLGQTTYG
jgi:hypothetical protein